MQIIGRTAYGYIIEASCSDVTSITGSNNSDGSGRPTLQAGTQINVHKCWNHINSITQFEERRKAMAEQLRAAATVIETTPSPLTLPEPPTESPSTP